MGSTLTDCPRYIMLDPKVNAYYISSAMASLEMKLISTLLYQCQNSSKLYFLFSICNHWSRFCEGSCRCHKPQSPFPQLQNLFLLHCWGARLRDSDSLPWWWNLDQTNWDEMCYGVMVSPIIFTRFTALLSQGLVHLVVSLHCLGVIKYLNQCHCTGWRYLNIYISVTALAGGI